MRAMKRGNHLYAWSALFLAFGLAVWIGCDSGEKALDEITGNRAVKQYHKSKKDLEKISDKQAEKYQNIPDEEKEREKTE
jgi:hypothetical protein